MEESLNKKSRTFKIVYSGLNLSLELFTIEYIEEKLKPFEQNQIIRLAMPFHEWKKIYADAYGNKKYHFFAYIKFMEFEGQKYGLVGGKTNYPRPDISFDYKKDSQDKRIARAILNSNKSYKWSHDIIIVNHEPFLDKEKDNQQALFLEKFLQLQFHLFDS